MFFPGSSSFIQIWDRHCTKIAVTGFIVIKQITAVTLLSAQFAENESMFIVLFKMYFQTDVVVVPAHVYLEH